MTKPSALLNVQNLSASYQGLPVLENTNLQVQKYDIVCLLGNSGCGKTTLLRSIAGLHEITQGQIELDQKLLSNASKTLAPEFRNIGMMFQDLALFPHLTIYENVAFGIRKQAKSFIKSRVEHVLALVDIQQSQYKKYPHELSGGQQQRVALARAIAPQPTLLLLDEPFSSLDPELREQLATQVRDILKQEQVTTVMVTHDQKEAFVMADWVGVMHQGEIVQFDTPYNIYHQPTSRFVADFVGLGDLIPVQITAHNTVRSVFGEIKGEIPAHFELHQEYDLLVRPDDIPHDDDSPIKAIIEEKRFLGAEFIYTLRLPNGQKLSCYAPSHHNHPIGQPLGIRLELEHLVLFSK